MTEVINVMSGEVRTYSLPTREAVKAAHVEDHTDAADSSRQSCKVRILERQRCVVAGDWFARKDDTATDSLFSVAAAMRLLYVRTPNLSELGRRAAQEWLDDQIHRLLPPPYISNLEVLEQMVSEMRPEDRATATNQARNEIAAHSHRLPAQELRVHLLHRALVIFLQSYLDTVRRMSASRSLCRLRIRVEAERLTVVNIRRANNILWTHT